MDTPKEKTTDEHWILQVSPKTASGTLANVRGRNEEEFAEALRLFQKYGPQFGFTSTGNGTMTSTTQTPQRYVTPTTDSNVAKMQVKQAPPDGTYSIITTIEAADKRTGTSATGKAWELWNIKTTDKTYGIFDTKLGFALSKMIGVTLKLTLKDKEGKKGGVFTDIVSFEEAAEIV